MSKKKKVKLSDFIKLVRVPQHKKSERRLQKEHDRFMRRYAGKKVKDDQRKVQQAKAIKKRRARK